MLERPLVVVSNRGPLSFTLDGGDLRARRGGGGLATVVGHALEGTGATWVAGALTDADRVAAERGTIEADGFDVCLLALDPDEYRAYYDVISNATLWFLHHGLWDIPRRPRFDRKWHAAWEAYRRVNGAFAKHIATVAPENAMVLVQDYHLSLASDALRAERPDVVAVHFHHTPFATPRELGVLPDAVADELMSSLCGFAACGFHNARWSTAFEACASDRGLVAPPTFVSPATADADDISGVAASPACNDALDALDRRIGSRKLVVRVDRIELSKNIVRGFLAFDELLRAYPEWREAVVFGAFVYPSREGLIEYQAYRQEVEGVIQRINAEWSTPSWTPIVYDPNDDFTRSVAALRRYDVLLVNPVRDGLNLVAKEGPIVNERDGVLVLSRESGVWAELGESAVGINPFDISETADALHRSLSIGHEERRARAVSARRTATARTAVDWLGDQVAAASR